MTAQNIGLYCFLALSIVLILYAVVVLWKIFRGDINIDGLLCESPAQGQPANSTKASLSRFQFLIFSFVIAGLFLLLSIQAGTFVDIPVNVLGLLGISGGSYLVSKAVG
jgi:uncharacterized membrane protein